LHECQRVEGEGGPGNSAWREEGVGKIESTFERILSHVVVDSIVGHSGPSGGRMVDLEFYPTTKRKDSTSYMHKYIQKKKKDRLTFTKF
jgi:hypothetical protein